ncbi:hypothetical protein Taro_037143 [Colocasia esculenta]|uniref:Uncharacterized protein n=1 Tax=Colocasia esculenta TaxID=4460 RepID=A0A843WAB8_COLES|nr:hypothetical protein [Colocasia esculenta]
MWSGRQAPVSAPRIAVSLDDVPSFVRRPKHCRPSTRAPVSDLRIVPTPGISVSLDAIAPYGEIFTAGIDGSGVQWLTHNSFEYETPAWSPIYMEPADVAEASHPCEFEDCHWLDQGAAARFASGDHPRCGENLSS